MKQSKKTPGWFIALVVLLTGGIAGYAFYQSPTAAGDIENSVYPLDQVPKNLVPALGYLTVGMNNGTIAAAGMSPPRITAGAVPIHPDRGTCTACHEVLSSRGAAIPKIASGAVMPHEYRGVCTNCHQLAGAVASYMPPMTGAAFQQPLPSAAMPEAAPLPLPAPAPVAQPAAAVPTEAEWLGLETAPITPQTATQYGLAPGAKGLVIADTEAVAFDIGLKAGDVLLSINGVPVQSMTDFVSITQNGKLSQGTVEILRGQNRFVADLSSAAPTVNAAGGNQQSAAALNAGVSQAVGQATLPQAAAVGNVNPYPSSGFGYTLPEAATLPAAQAAPNNYAGSGIWGNNSALTPGVICPNAR